MAKVTIYHNPRCAKSRATLKLLEDRGIQPQIVEYLKTPPDEKTLQALLKKLGLGAADLVRGKEHKALGLRPTDDPRELIRRMARHPEIIERPIVVVGGKARLGRPPENVLDIL